MGFFIGDVFAAGTTTQAPHADGTFPLIMIAAIFVVFYFMLIRPQNKRAKEHRDLVGALKKGDEVTTSGGILGKVVSIDEQYIKLALSEGVEITMQRGSISSVLPKGTLKSL
ncbi:MAG: preprotein translocase subunit YajC [Tatlockia sp.]|nr:preprotein translocase subunit YajC [Tatlockia sp.]